MNAELNIENPLELLNYLRDGGSIEKNTEVRISLLSGGVSNRTVLLEFDDGSSWVMKQALDKLRVDGDWFCSPERIFYEAEAMRWLDQYVHGNTPKLIFEDQSQYILAMEAVQPPFENLKTLLISSPPKSIYFKSKTRSKSLNAMLYAPCSMRPNIKHLLLALLVKELLFPQASPVNQFQ